MAPSPGRCHLYLNGRCSVGDRNRIRLPIHPKADSWMRLRKSNPWIQKKRSPMAKKKIAILTGGGDCPGINAVIRAVTKKAIHEKGMEVIGIEDGYHGMIENRHRPLTYNDVSGILTLGGTIRGTSKTATPYHYAVKKGDRLEFQ